MKSSVRDIDNDKKQRVKEERKEKYQTKEQDLKSCSFNYCVCYFFFIPKWKICWSK